MKWKIIGAIVLVLLAIAVTSLVLLKGNPFAPGSLSDESESSMNGGTTTIDQLPQPLPPAAEAGGKVMASPTTEPNVQSQDSTPIPDLVTPPVATPEGGN